ncbi:MAG: holo-[acyl-carrier protein] synthase [Myxococcota bacterium]|jgi:holo-[acyl-carrier protein] synthase
MILGTGIDLVDVEGFALQLSDPASRFEEAVFTPAEIAYSHTASSGRPAQHLAVRFAAKEATVKALDVAAQRTGTSAPALIPLSNIEVIRDAFGRPAIDLHGEAAELADRLGVDRTFVSLTHDGRQAMASVVVERL